MCYQHVVSEGLASCALSGSFMSGTQTRKETSQDRLGLHCGLRAGRGAHVDCFHQHWRFLPPPAAIAPPETGMARMQPILQNLYYSSVYGNETLTTKAKPHACFIYNCFQTLRASLSYADNQHAQSTPTGPTNQQCMTAPESCSLRMPARVIAASPFTKADCQRPAFDICIGLVTRNVGIIHISLTGL